LLLVVAACARPGDTAAAPPGLSGDEFEQRAVAVAETWRTTVRPEQWRTGYVPLQEPTVLTGDPKFTEATKQAFLAGWYRSSMTLPREQPPKGTVRFPDGTLTVPLISAAEAYRELDQGDPPPCPPRASDRPPAPPTVEGQPSSSPPDASTSVAPAGDGPSRDPQEVIAGPAVACTSLTVTGVTLGTTTIRTSRGDAEVPAWVFTVKELAVPVARVAVAPSAVTAVPSVPTPPGDLSDRYVASQDLTAVEGTKLGFRLGVGACDRDIRPLVREFDDVVVVGGMVRRSEGPCTMQLAFHPVEVTLERPVGARPVLDVVTGQPLRLAATQ